MGFVHPEHEGLLDGLAVTYDKRGNVSVGNQNDSSVKGVFAAGDAATGSSLVVRAMSSGKQAAEFINAYLNK
jgi:glutamate synthase (NADPH) small chain